MRWNIQDWVEEVKGKPEHIRQRYVIGCVAASMFFVVIVWSLTVTEGFKKSVAKTETTTNGGLLPKPSDFSLDDILSGKDAAGTVRSKSGEEFVREQTENRTRLNPDEEGVTPKGDKPAGEDEALPLP
jgi:hypothetical protein